MISNENKKIGALNQNRELLRGLIIIAVFMLSLYGRRLLSELGIVPLDWPGGNAGMYLGYLTWLIPTFLTILFFCGFRFRKAASELGVGVNPGKAFIFAFLVTLPMMLGYWAYFGDNAQGSAGLILTSALLPAVMEEYLFRGFLFGQLFKPGRFGFVPAVILSSVIFGLGHLYQGNSLGSALMVITVTAVGGAWFAWLYVEWNRNLWLVISLHFFMNLWWAVFPAGQTAVGTAQANIFRFLTIAITVIVTIYRGRRNGFKIAGSIFAAPEKRRRI